jgi:hypothetical protein
LHASTLPLRATHEAWSFILYSYSLYIHIHIASKVARFQLSIIWTCGINFGLIYIYLINIKQHGALIYISSTYKQETKFPNRTNSLFHWTGYTVSASLCQPMASSTSQVHASLSR